MKRREFITLLGGAAASWPFAARAQQAERIRRVGHEKYLPEFDGLREQLRELGYIEGKNLAINWRYADQGPVELLVLARKLVDLHPDVLVSITTPATAAVKAVAGSIPAPNGIKYGPRL